MSKRSFDHISGPYNFVLNSHTTRLCLIRRLINHLIKSAFASFTTLKFYICEGMDNYGQKDLNCR